jgi:hypothetical protein
VPDPDAAWRTLSLVNDWLKYAEAKLGILLTAAAGIGGVLFNLVTSRAHASVAFDTAACVCGASVLAAGTCAVMGLYPVVKLRRRSDTDAANPLFFHDVARAYKGDALSYGAVLHTLTTDHDVLVQQLSQQIHANATVAQRKYRWANRAIYGILLAVLAIAALATIVALKIT